MAAIPAGQYAGNANRFDTALTIINRVAVEVGLGRVADPYAAAAVNPDYQLLCDLLTSIGQEIAGQFSWQATHREVAFVTDASGTYDLPTDFREMIADTAVDRTNTTPIQVATPARWQTVKALDAGGGTCGLHARIVQDRLLLHPATEGLNAVLEYRSKTWVLRADGVTYSHEPVGAGDKIMLDTLLVIRRLKMAFRDARGFDTTALAEDYARTLEVAMATDAPKPTCDVGGSGPTGFRLLDEYNLPSVIPGA